MQATLVALLSVFLPILLVELPVLLETMGSIRGKYDVLSVAFPLTRAQALQLIPSDVRSEQTLLAVPDHVFDVVDPSKTLDRTDGHVALLQMGYQISTGPGPTWVPKFSFSECKLEIPFVRHPKAGGKSNKGMVYKQTILFSNPVIKMGSSATGLTSASASFVPPASPNIFPADAATLTYEATGYVEAKGSLIVRTEDVQQNLDASWSVYRDLAEGWWFGQGTGNKVQRFTFDFDQAQVPPTPYDVSVELNLNAFSPSKNDGEAERIRVQSVGWRSRASLSSSAATLAEIERE